MSLDRFVTGSEEMAELCFFVQSFRIPVGCSTSSASSCQSLGILPHVQVSQMVSRELEKECIIVFDEAHNIDNVCIEVRPLAPNCSATDEV